MYFRLNSWVGIGLMAIAYDATSFPRLLHFTVSSQQHTFKNLLLQPHITIYSSYQFNLRMALNERRKYLEAVRICEYIGNGQQVPVILCMYYTGLPYINGAALPNCVRSIKHLGTRICESVVFWRKIGRFVLK